MNFMSINNMMTTNSVGWVNSASITRHLYILFVGNNYVIVQC
jgi:hypothetical protein